MAVKAERVTVTTAATLLSVAAEADYTPDAPNFALTYGQHCMVRNRDVSASIFVGGPDVTAAAGFEVLPGEVVPVDLLPADQLYGITATGSVICHVIQAGV